jgi:hypothetical protein
MLQRLSSKMKDLVMRTKLLTTPASAQSQPSSSTPASSNPTPTANSSSSNTFSASAPAEPIRPRDDSARKSQFLDNVSAHWTQIFVSSIFFTIC